MTTTQPAVSFASIAVGAASGATQSLTFTIPSGTTLGGVSVVTQGVANLDFTPATGGTCASGTTGASCTVEVQFLPKAAGRRLGAVLLTDQSGNTLITVPLTGIGTAPLVGFAPATISSLSSSAALAGPSGMVMDAAGNLYISNFTNNVVSKLTPGGTLTTVAGNGTAGHSGDGGPAISAELNSPIGIALDGAGNLYIADSLNDAIRMVTPAGIINTVAGGNSGGGGYGGNGGPATSALLCQPYSVAVDGVGNFYIADFCNFVVRKVNLAGTISTIAGDATAGYSGDGGPATSAELYFVYDVALDAAGNLFIADGYNNVVRKVTPSGTISTVAGNNKAGAGYSGDGGAATSAQLSQPSAVATDAAGNVYVSDYKNNVVRRFVPGGSITTVAGSESLGAGYSGDGGSATGAQLYGPWKCGVDGSGNLYVADSGNNLIRKVDLAAPPSFTFDATTGSASASQDVTVMNPGNATLNIGTISTAASFSLDGAATSCSSTGQNLAPAASCVLGIEFNPSEPGSIKGSVVLADNKLNGSTTQSIAVSGTATGPALPTANPSVASLTFTSLLTGSTSTVQTVTLTNSSTIALSITSIASSGDFAQTNTCGGSLKAGGNCSISVTFTPTLAGTRTGTLTITDNASPSTQTVTLTGTGATIALSGPSTALTVSTPGSSATASIKLSPSAAVTGSLNLTCSVTYTGKGTATDTPTCSLNPSQAAISGTSAVSAKLTVSTTAPSTSNRQRNRQHLGGALAALLFLGVVPWKRRLALAMLALACIVSLGAAIGCGSGTGSGSHPGNSVTDAGTTAGNYNVVVTATSGKFTASTTVALSVQ